MPPKKRKANFDIEELERGYEEKKQWFSKLESIVEGCCLSDAAEFLSTDNILLLSGLKFGFRFIENLMSILSVVPEEAGPWRIDIVDALLSALQSPQFRFIENLMSILSVVPEEAGPWRIDIVDALLSALQSPQELNPEQKKISLFISKSFFKNGFPGHKQCYSEVFSRALQYSSTQQLQANQTNITSLLPFAGCVCPPTKTCLLCHQELQKNNKPCVVTYYLVNGPLPVLKVELRCRSCGLNYGITKYGNGVQGYKFYDSTGIVEASDAVYVERLVLSLFAALRQVLLYIIHREYRL